MRSILVSSALLAVNYARDPAIIDGFSESSFSWFDADDGPLCGNGVVSPTFSSPAWCADQNGDGAAASWLQVDLGDVYIVSEVATKGRDTSVAQWVASYQLFGSSTDDTFPDSFTDYGNFGGNTDQNTEVAHAMSPDITVRYLRFVPLTYYVHKSMRIEAYGVVRSTAAAVCDVIDIDVLLSDCSSAFASQWTDMNARVDNIVSNAGDFWTNDPSAAKTQSQPRMILFDGIDIEDNANNLIMLSLLLNVVNFVIICIGACVCWKAGVCGVFTNGTTVRYKFSNESVSDDEVIAMVHQK